jgi:hypothetical protein
MRRETLQSMSKKFTKLKLAKVAESSWSHPEFEYRQINFLIHNPNPANMLSRSSDRSHPR